MPSAITIDVVVVESTMTVHEPVTTTATSTYTLSPTFSSLASTVSVSPSSLPSMVSSLAQGPNAHGTITPMHINGASISIIVITLLFAAFCVGFGIWGDVEACQRWFCQIMGRDNGEGDNEGEGKNDRSQSTTRGMELPTVTRSYSVEHVDLERGMPPQQSSSSSSASASTIQDKTLRWPFWPGVVAPPTESTRAENRIVVEALTEDYGINTAKTVRSVPASVVSVGVPSRNNSTAGGPASTVT